MSLVYLVTRLPKLTLGGPAPITRAALISEARASLENHDLNEFERVAMLEEVEETVRTLHRAAETEAANKPAQLAAFVRTQRTRTALDRGPRDLPEWLLDPVGQHVLMRRYWQRLVQETQSERLRTYAQFHVNLEEALTGLRCQRENLSHTDFLEQMSGHFDSSARVIVDNYAQQQLGIGLRFAWWPRMLAALDQPDRVAAEQALDRLRFSALDDLEGISTFSVESVVATYFRLRIIERQSSWSSERGLEVLERVLRIPALERTIGDVT